MTLNLNNASGVTVRDCYNRPLVAHPSDDGENYAISTDYGHPEWLELATLYVPMNATAQDRREVCNMAAKMAVAEQMYLWLTTMCNYAEANGVDCSKARQVLALADGGAFVNEHR